MGEALPKNLRQEFARWMQTGLGYGAVRTNVRLDVASGERAETVDVRGERWSENARRLQSAGWMLFIVAVVLENVTALREAVFVAPSTLLGVSVVSFVAAYGARRRTREYAWVSCENRKKPLGSGDVRRLREAVNAQGDRGDARWKPAEVILVSGAAGFEPSAVELAKALDIQCYRRIDTGFERVT